MTKFRVSDYNDAVSASQFDWTGRLTDFNASINGATVNCNKRWGKITVSTEAGSIDLSGLLK